MEWKFEAHQKSTVADVLADTLAPEEKKRFKTWSQEVCTDDFNRLLETWFREDIIKDNLATYVIQQIESLAHFTGTRVASLVQVGERQYDYNCFNETLHV